MSATIIGSTGMMMPNPRNTVNIISAATASLRSMQRASFRYP